MSRSPWSIKSPPRGNRPLPSPYLEPPTPLSAHSRQSSNASLSTIEGPSAITSQSIFGASLQQSVAISNIALRVRDARGELKTWGYIPVVVAKWLGGSLFQVSYAEI
ncbi:hypothetical protein M407DRAFT_31778 [Tulasnella calospora MUT 4182]|uniref:Uncharacterized protein n=1 Tax=Tulasnella calospora MUT 4182 TaxID=1051891 RepID=A0A0C3Q5V9_9AGAM|nr:hypothetical protein M407DRAFT_31778 [Tulasnella calospora MUT 4182]